MTAPEIIALPDTDVIDRDPRALLYDGLSAGAQLLVGQAFRYVMVVGGVTPDGKTALVGRPSRMEDARQRAAWRVALRRVVPMGERLRVRALLADAMEGIKMVRDAQRKRPAREAVS